ncbi:prenyltransferase [Alkalibacter rhizosphaerae]|uniref:Prenyltransferase n=2 Tax=Alkalibacter rhizosphaerae TaxID=2815577 RepID=A0A974XGX9_9FIRM|nr:prenyltransferase [Alkalibacter rhizosphaerae]QSX09613.1 prenyltransferase [Alkalibacter rhizosphaerae]
MEKRFDLGWDYWTTPDKRLTKGGVFSAIGSTLMLLELSVDRESDLMKELSELFFSCQREDGRFKLSPNGAIYPCHTIYATNALCHLGQGSDERLRKTYEHLFQIQYGDGGWRCNKFSYGRGPETEFSNPGTTLHALNAFRFTKYLNHSKELDKAVEFLLKHWEVKVPIGPCHYGIGTLFMQVEYPFSNYNLFLYVYVLSFYDSARKDPRFLEALDLLQSKLVDGMIVVERVNSKLSGFDFCRKGDKSVLATRRFREILENMKK